MRSTFAALPLALMLSACSGEEILHGLDEPQANEVLVALDEGGLRATKARDDAAEGAWTVSVPAREAARAHRLLAERALPRARPAGFGDVFGKGSMVPTPIEEHARYLQALAGELARSVESIDGVVEARVHLGLPQDDPLRPGERRAPRGAVLVKCRPSACGSVRALEGGIRALVAGSADGLDAAAVSVVFAPGTEARPPAPVAGRPSRALLGLAGVAALGAVALAGAGVRVRLRGGGSA